MYQGEKQKINISEKKTKALKMPVTEEIIVQYIRSNKLYEGFPGNNVDHSTVWKLLTWILRVNYIFQYGMKKGQD